MTATSARVDPKWSDHAKAFGIRAMRWSHRRTLETTSAKTYRRRVVPTSPSPRLMPAARVHKGMGWLPTSLIVPDVLPKEAKLPLPYYLAYYATSKIGWTLYGKSPIDPDVTFDPSSTWNEWFPDASRGWGSPTDDAAFTALRLQGPNPCMLRAANANPDLGETGYALIYSLDFGPLFDGVFPATEARFATTSTGLKPLSIRIGERVVTPDHDGWADAKRVVNGLDARYAIFIRHLLNVHLMVGQAYALAAYALPVWHPLRPFMQFFTYGTLVVNDAAYKALLTPDSYFIRSNFVSADDAHTLIENAMTCFDFREWCWPLDKTARGLAGIPNHPFVEEAEPLWEILERTVRRHLVHLDLDAAAIDADRDLRRWHEMLTEVLPDDSNVPDLASVDDLVLLMTALLWNNVIHEVCGNLSPLLDTRDDADLAAVNFENLRALADPDRQPSPPTAADVFLMDQATHVSRFNVAGNALMEVDANANIDDPRLRDLVIDLQRELVAADAAVDERNRRRLISFETMRPKKFEASISF